MDNADRSLSSSSNSRSHRHAGAFRNIHRSSRIMHVLDEMGSKRILQQHGQLHLISHPAMLNTLKLRALRYANRNQTQSQSDLELFHSAVLVHSSSQQSLNLAITIDTQEDQDIATIIQHEPLIQPIGIVPGKKADGITRPYYENMNGISTLVSNNAKLNKVKELMDELEVDILTFNEHKINFQHKDNRHTGLGKLFHGSETMAWSVGGNIKHLFVKQFGCRMEGGTGIVS